MHRSLSILLFSVVFLLAACGGGETPAPPTVDTSVSNPTAEPAGQVVQPAEPTLIPPPGVEPTADVPGPTPEPTEPRAAVAFGVTVPAPGTVVAVETEDPDSGLPFSKIIYYQSGGAGSPVSIEVHSDGTVIRDGVSMTISPDQVSMLQSLINQANFFGISGVFTSPGSSPQVMRWRVSVERSDGSSAAISMEEGLVPAALAPLVGALGAIGQ
ncbi:MAG: hypothetical protein H6672_14230 [Anaerolineaceae bacterium]|nr:hypothetical protein [Anaerolineaceae bacterium]